jgi:hypothetical protein
MWLEGVKVLCVNDASGPPLSTSLLVLFGAPGASPVDRGWVWGAGHRNGPRRTEGDFGTRGWERKIVRCAQIPLGMLWGTRLEMLLGIFSGLTYFKHEKYIFGMLETGRR